MTAWLSRLPIGHLRQAWIALSIAASVSGRSSNSSAPFSTIFASRPCAPATSSGMSEASGMFFQYFLGISLSIAPIFRRAGLKMEA